jgi:hypothetical protein
VGKWLRIGCKVDLERSDRRIKPPEWNSQAKDSEQYETVAFGQRQRLLQVFALTRITHNVMTV